MFLSIRTIIDYYFKNLMSFRYNDCKTAGELVFVKKSFGFASQNPRIFFMAKRQIPLDAVLHRFRSRSSDFFEFSYI